jgi:hypothetical protein
MRPYKISHLGTFKQLLYLGIIKSSNFKEIHAKRRIRRPARNQILKNCPEKQTENSWNPHAGMEECRKMGLSKN